MRKVTAITKRYVVDGEVYEFTFLRGFYKEDRYEGLDLECDSKASTSDSVASISSMPPDGAGSLQSGSGQRND